MQDNSKQSPENQTPDVFQEPPPWKTTRPRWKDYKSDKSDINEPEIKNRKQNTSQPIHPMSIIKKLLFPLILLLVILALTFWRYNVVQTLNIQHASQPKTDQTQTAPIQTNQKEYKDPSLNFRLIYPANMNAARIPERGDNMIGGAAFQRIQTERQEDERPSQLYLWVFHSQGQELENWIAQNTTNEPQNSGEKKEFYNTQIIERKTIDGEEGIAFTSSAFDFEETNLAVKNGELIYVLGYVDMSDDLEEEYTQIIASIEFGAQTHMQCDARTSCPTGFDCMKFEDEQTPICWGDSPCAKCESKQCTIAESYPPQIFCL